MAAGEAEVNQCPPGGAEGVARLASLLGRPPLPLNPANGTEGPRGVAVIDESWCIGCTLCIDACPTDAVLGTNKRMHTIVERYCTGCELCVPVCPVDCISMETVSGERTGWAAWSPEDAALALQRYEARKQRLAREEAEHAERLERKARERLEDLPNLAKDGNVDRKPAVVEAALARSRAKR